MRMLFLAPIFRRDEENLHLELSKGIIAPSANSLPWSIIDGLESFGITVDIINVLPVGTYPRQYKKLALKTKRWSHGGKSENLEIGSINLPLVKQFARTIKIRREVRKWTKKSNDNRIIVLYCLYQPFMSAIKNLPADVKVTAIVPDLPQFIDTSTKKRGMVQLLKSLNTSIINRLVNRIDSFVVLTESMRELLGVCDKPFTVVEGIVPDISHISRDNQGDCLDADTRAILYTGTLNYQYGIKNLLYAFSKITDPKYRLWICGVGEAESDIIRLCKADERISYFGHVNREKVYELQSQATVLVNPRTNEGEYTKYSFPSKTMEYMASGKPVIMYKLAGIPGEYDKFLFYVEDNSVDALTRKIIEICSKDSEDLHIFGQKARDWVLNNKNNRAQVKKIVDLIRENDEEVQSILDSDDVYNNLPATYNK